MNEDRPLNFKCSPRDINWSFSPDVLVVYLYLYLYLCMCIFKFCICFETMKNMNKTVAFPCLILKICVSLLVSLSIQAHGAPQIFLKCQKLQQQLPRRVYPVLTLDHKFCATSHPSESIHHLNHQSHWESNVNSG